MELIKLLNSALESIEPSFILFQFLKEKKVESVTASEVNMLINNAEKIIKKLNLNPGSRVGLLSENSVEWFVTFTASLRNQLTVVVFDYKNPDDLLIDSIKFADLGALFLSKTQFDRFNTEQLEKLIICNINENWLFNKENFDSITNNYNETATDLNQEIAAMIFTSGTLGKSKLVQLTHSNLVFTLNAYKNYTLNRSFSFLPWNHVYGLTSSLLVFIYVKKRIVFSNSTNPDELAILFRETKPNMMSTIPLFLEMIYNKIQAELKNKPYLIQFILKQLIKICTFFRIQTNSNFLDKIIFKLIYKKFGGNLTRFISGGASLPEDPFNFLQSIGFEIYEGYGLTESSACGVINNIGTTIAGSIGSPLDKTEISIINVDKYGCGELCLKGPNISQGYFRNIEENEKTFINGWLHTGDIAKQDSNGNIYIIGRQKEIIITEDGQKISPIEIERYYSGILGVKEFVVVAVKSRETKSDETHGVFVIDTNFSQITEINNLKKSIENKINEISRKLPKIYSINFIHFRDTIPKTSTLKVKRTLLSREIEKEIFINSTSSTNNNPTSVNVLEKIPEILASLLNLSAEKIDCKKTIRSYLHDSIRLISFFSDIKDAYPNTLTVDNLSATLTLEELSQLIVTNQQQPILEKQKDIIATKEKQNNLQKTTAIKTLKRNKLFLTGVTGILGSYVLKLLLEDDDDNLQLFCLCQPKNSIEQTFERMQGFLKVYNTSEKALERLRNRVIPIPGDVTQKHFGLDQNTFEDLTQKIDAVVHIAGKVSLHGLYDELKPVNVTGVENAIEFSLNTQQKLILNVSSYSIMGYLQFQNTAPFTEDDFDLGQSFENLGYQRSKFEGEKLVRAAQEKGLNWIVVRPGNIFGESATGAYPFGKADLSGIFYDIVKTVVETKLAMLSPLYFDITPVDYVARGIVYFIRNLEEANLAFHLCNPNHRRYFEIIQSIRNIGYQIELVSVDEYFSRLKNHMIKVNNQVYTSMTTELLRFNPMGLASMESSYPDATKTSAILKSAGIICHPIDEKLLSTYLDYCKKVGVIKI